MITFIKYYNIMLSAIYDEKKANTQTNSIDNDELYYNDEDYKYYIDLVDYYYSYYDDYNDY
jgi:hypothetical protein